MKVAAAVATLLLAIAIVNVVSITALAVNTPPAIIATTAAAAKINHVQSGGWWNRRVSRSGAAAPAPPPSSNPLPSSSSMRPMVDVPAGAQLNPIVNQLRAYTIVNPIIHETNGQRTQSELGPGEHPDRMSYTLRAFDKSFVVHMEKATDLFSADYKEIRLAYDSQNPTAAPTQHVNENPVHCYYNGRVEGDRNAIVALTTCSGLKGHILAHGEDFSIEPAAYSPPSHLNVQSLGGFSTSSLFSSSAYQSTEAAFTNTSHPVQHASARHHAFPLSRISAIEHIVYRTQDLETPSKSCGVSHDGLHPSAEHLSIPHEDDTDRVRSDDAAAAGPRVEPVLSASGSSTPTEDVIELLVFNDHARWKNKGQGVEADTLSIVNSVKEWYKTTTFTRPTRVVLVGQVTFSEGDPYNAKDTDSGVSVEGNQGLLTVFHEYRSQAAAMLPKHDSGQLFSERQFTSNIMGLAGVGAMCSFYSGSICCMTGLAMVTNAMIAAHETGHTLSMLHDGSQGVPCPNSGFIMQTTTGTATTFSQCSISAADGFMDGSSSTCLQN